jgi:glycosyltransferase involved in cell wall biosynthesis
VVLCVANLIRRKNIDALLRAWARVASTPARLRIVGSGPEESALRSLTRELRIPGDSVAFTGALPRDRVRQALAECHVFCLPSRQEAFGLAFLEAMATGRPVVGARAAGVPEVVGDAGILVPEDDPAALADALHDLIASSALRQELAGRGQVRAQQFSWDRAAGRFGDSLAHLV